MTNKLSEISIKVSLNEEGIPERITWNAPEAGPTEEKESKCMILSLWDKQEGSAMRLDLWTQEMRIDEMDKMYFQTLYTMAENYKRATNNEKGAKDLMDFAVAFGKKAGVIKDD